DPPLNLPEEKTRTTLRTQTHKGKGFNELRFDDAKGLEEVYLHAQKDMNVMINHDAHWHIKHDYKQRVEHSSYQEILADEHQQVHGSRLQRTQGDVSQQIAGKQHTQVGQSLVINSGQEIHLQTAGKLVLDAGSEITLKVGGDFIRVTPGGIFTSAGLRVASGGPGQGSALHLAAPETVAALANHDIRRPVSALPVAATIATPTPEAPASYACVACAAIAQMNGDWTIEGQEAAPITPTDTTINSSAQQASNTLAPSSGPGRWVTIDNDYHGISNTMIMAINRLTSMGDEGRLFGSEGKDFMNTIRDKIQAWQPLPDNASLNQAENSAIHPYGTVRKIKQRFLEGDDTWQITGKSWHWQPVVADEVYETKDKP
ncbi:bacteriophage T4 gp5 trimerisation domain-containing protein, partial [Serratia microhaemolytica]|uniref:bacteriophage T4 gp5 trimerisation domain-containing protein n=1 Tax=Serratia microhaemolytica TaxID=2675110 RepID=UPI003B832DAF